MEIISVIRGDNPSDPWRLSPSTKGIIPSNPLNAQMHRWFLVSISATKLIKKWPKTKENDDFFIKCAQKRKIYIPFSFSDLKARILLHHATMYPAPDVTCARERNDTESTFFPSFCYLFQRKYVLLPPKRLE